VNSEFIEALEQISAEKELDIDIILEAVEVSLTTACKKNFGNNHNVEVTIDRDTGEIHVFSNKEVKEEPNKELGEISILEAQEYMKNPQVGDIVKIEVTPKDFGRVAAQKAKQVVVQKLREAEREIIYNEYLEKEKEIVTGIIQKITKTAIFVNLGKIEAIMPLSEQVHTEKYEMNQRIKAIITQVEQTTKGPQIVVSRASSEFLRRLFEQEVPEVYDGIVEIKGIVREAGSKSKVAVLSHDKDVEPLGACVGKAGQRINNIMKELNGEKIDIVVWSNDIEEFIKAALSPAKVIDININHDEKIAEVIVPESELSLAIGKNGQNVRMAAKIVGCKIDIKGDSFQDNEGKLEE